MKKAMFVLLVLSSIFLTCELQEKEKNSLITCDYASEFYVFIFNQDTKSLYVTSKSEISKEDVEKFTGKLGNMDIRAEKVLGDAYSDKGNLILTLWNDNTILVSDIAQTGDKEAQIFYNF